MFARTPRLLLRPGWAEDAPALVQALSDVNVARNLARVPVPYTLSHAQEFLARPYDERVPRALIFTRAQTVPQLVGGCGLIRADNGEIHLGYWIARPHWGLGFATEAAGALIRAGRAMGHKRFIARHAIDNQASGRVMRKLGFVPTGALARVPSLSRGEAVLSAVYELNTLEDEPRDMTFALKLYPDAGSDLAA